VDRRRAKLRATLGFLQLVPTQPELPLLHRAFRGLASGYWFPVCGTKARTLVR
jgi:hypothetical protein